MAELDLDQTVDQMLAPSAGHLAELERALVGTGGEAREAYLKLSKAAGSLPGIGKSVADEVARLRADDSLPRDHRYRLAEEKRAAADIVVRKLNEGAQA